MFIIYSQVVAKRKYNKNKKMYKDSFFLFLQPPVSRRIRAALGCRPKTASRHVHHVTVLSHSLNHHLLFIYIYIYKVYKEGTRHIFIVRIPAYYNICVIQ